jgi:hypothetical protein
MTMDGPPNHTNDQEVVWREEGGRQTALMEKETGEPVYYNEEWDYCMNSERES